MTTKKSPEKWTSDAALPSGNASFTRFVLLNLSLLLLVFVLASVSGLCSLLINVSINAVVRFVFALNAIILSIQAIIILLKIIKLLKQKDSGKKFRIIISLCFLAALYPSLKTSAIILGMNDLLFGNWAAGG